MISRLRRQAGILCLATAPWVVTASPSTAAFIESQLSGERTVEEIRLLMLQDGWIDHLTRHGVEEGEAAWWVARSLETESLQTWARGEVVAGDAIRDDVWTVWRQAGPERQQVFARVVGVNVPGILLLLLPLAIAGAVLGASGGSAGAILGGAALVGLIFVLLANPKFVFGDR